MPASKRLLLFVITALVLVVTGCGGDSSLSFPPPQGSFTNANLSGPFAFSYSGSEGSTFLAVAGSIQADGNGHITSGTQDINSGFGVDTNIAVTGTYAVRADGRGSATLNSSAGNSTIDFVIVSGGHALITRFDNSATGSGTMDQQSTSAFSNSALAGPFAFSLSGIDTGEVPMALAGKFTSDASGNITSGINDANDNGIVLTNQTLTGSLPVAATGRGTATLNTIKGTLRFAFYVVDANHIKVVETDSLPVLAGEAFRQTGPFSNASVSGPFAFTVAGADLLSGGPFAAGGILTSNGSGNITAGIEDINDAGLVTTNVSLSGSYSIASTGRGTLTLNTNSFASSFVIYPSSGGVLALETDVGTLTTGVALQQTGTFSNAPLQGAYGLNFTGATTNAEVDAIAQFTADGASRLTGIIDLNNLGITFGQPLSGNFNVASSGRSTLTLQTPLGTQNLIVYTLNANRALFVEVDQDLVAVGDIRHQ
jgi:hypothetical protein